MGRRLDVLLGRTTKQTARLKTLLGLATTRLGVLRGHRQVRCAQARGDAEQLLRLGHPDRALLRAEQVVREQNALDVLLMLESYCNLVVERAALVDAHRECPEELREAAAGLVYAAARCGDLPELQEVRNLFAAKFGRDFVAAASDLRSGCGVNAKIVQKLSTRQPSLESRQMVLQEIAAEKGIAVRVHEPCHEDAGRSNQRNKRQDRAPREAEIEEDISDDSAQGYKDVEAAAQAAFESAASAAAAAKAAMELSRGKPRGPSDKIGHARNYSSETEDFPEDEANRGNVADSELKYHEPPLRLRLGHPAGPRVVVREQNALDVLKAYCNLVVDVHRECLEELREAAAGLVYAAKFGREFVAAVSELRRTPWRLKDVEAPWSEDISGDAARVQGRGSCGALWPPRRPPWSSPEGSPGDQVTRSDTPGITARRQDFSEDEAKRGNVADSELKHHE
ncbi:hypothetical protein EJB05_04929, partial [Eragrostis curvula]